LRSAGDIPPADAECLCECDNFASNGLETSTGEEGKERITMDEDEDESGAADNASGVCEVLRTSNGAAECCCCSKEADNDLPSTGGENPTS